MMKYQAPQSSQCLIAFRSHLLRQYLKLSSDFEHLQQAIVHFIQHGSEPKVSRRQDRYGNLYYRVYNPLTGISAIFGSEAEVRWWLEQR
jgi:hypothetical protein